MRRNSPHPPVTYATYSAQFLTRDFLHLIEEMEMVELQLQQDLHLAMLETLGAQGAEIRGDVVELDGVFYKLFVSAPPGTRHLHIVLGDVSRRQTTLTATVTVDGFGLIRTISLEAPATLERIAESLTELAASHYKRAYIALETAFVATYGDWVATLFSTAYGIVNSELLVRGYEDLGGRFWFSVTDLDRMTFRYHFSRENLTTTVRWLCQNQDQFVSPCAAAALLITEDVADGVIGIPEPAKTTRYDDRTLIVEFSALPTLGVNTAFWVAEKHLFEDDALAAIHIEEIDDRAFELNCPAKSVELFIRIVDECRDDLVSVIDSQYGEFKKEQRKLHDAVERAKVSVSWMHEAGTDFAAKVVAELIRA